MCHMESAQDIWTPYEPTAATPWNLRRAVHMHRRAGFAATWPELERDLRGNPQDAVTRLIAGKSRIDGAPAWLWPRLRYKSRRDFLPRSSHRKGSVARMPHPGPRPSLGDPGCGAFELGERNTTSFLSLEGQLIVECGDRLLADNRIDPVLEIQDGRSVQLLEGRHQVSGLLVIQVVRLVKLIHPKSPCESIQCPFDQLDMNTPTVNGVEADVGPVINQASLQLGLKLEHGR